MPSRRIRGAELHFQDQGSGDAVVLLHGLGASSLDWVDQQQALHDRYRVIVPDLRGFGRSRHAPGPFGPVPFAADIAALLDQLDLRAAHLVGHSMGGAVALQMAADEPARWHSLTIVNSQPSFRAETLAQRSQYWLREATVRLFGLDSLARRTAARLAPGAEQGELRALIAAHYADNEPAVYLAVLEAMAVWDLRPALPTVGCPVLIVRAEHDYFSRELTESWLHSLPDARFIEVPGTHHALPQEAPERFNQLLLAFLAAARS